MPASGAPCSSEECSGGLHVLQITAIDILTAVGGSGDSFSARMAAFSHRTANQLGLPLRHKDAQSACWRLQQPQLCATRSHDSEDDARGEYTLLVAVDAIGCSTTCLRSGFLGDVRNETTASCNK
jgi:hypothetical protein